MPAVLIAVPPKIDWSGLEADELLRERSPLPCGARRARNQDNTLTAGRLFHQHHVLIFGLVRLVGVYNDKQSTLQKSCSHRDLRYSCNEGVGCTAAAP